MSGVLNPRFQMVNGLPLFRKFLGQGGQKSAWIGMKLLAQTTLGLLVSFIKQAACKVAVAMYPGGLCPSVARDGVAFPVGKANGKLVILGLTLTDKTVRQLFADRVNA